MDFGAAIMLILTLSLASLAVAAGLVSMTDLEGSSTSMVRNAAMTTSTDFLPEATSVDDVPQQPHFLKDKIPDMQDFWSQIREKLPFQKPNTTDHSSTEAPTDPLESIASKIGNWFSSWSEPPPVKKTGGFAPWNAIMNTAQCFSKEPPGAAWTQKFGFLRTVTQPVGDLLHGVVSSFCPGCITTWEWMLWSASWPLDLARRVDCMCRLLWEYFNISHHTAEYSVLALITGIPMGLLGWVLFFISWARTTFTSIRNAVFLFTWPLVLAIK